LYYDINKKIELPSNVYTKKIENHYLLLAANIPTWVVLDENEHNLYKCYSNKKTLKEILFIFKQSSNLSDSSTLNTMQSFLEKIEFSDFFSDSKSNNSEDITEITKNFQFLLTNNCNMNCKHCYLSAGIKKENELSFSEWKYILNQIHNEYKKGVEIVFSGGEPLMCDYTLELLKISKFNKNKNILFTNGKLITAQNIVDLKENISEVQISCEGITKDTYEYFRGKGNYQYFVNALKLLTDNDFKTTLAVTIVGEKSLYDLEKNLINFLNSLPNKNNLNIRLNETIEKKGNAVDLANNVFEYSHKKNTRVTNLIKLLKKDKVFLGKQLNKSIKFLNCGIGANVFISSEGKYFPCSEFHGDFGNIRTKKLKEVLLEFNQLNNSTTIKNMEKCKSCDLKYVCSGGCRVINKLINNDYLKPICNQDFINSKYNELLIDFFRSYDAE